MSSLSPSEVSKNKEKSRFCSDLYKKWPILIWHRSNCIIHLWFNCVCSLTIRPKMHKAFVEHTTRYVAHLLTIEWKKKNYDFLKKNENAMLNRQVNWEESVCGLELTDNRVLSSHAAGWCDRNRKNNQLTTASFPTRHIDEMENCPSTWFSIIPLFGEEEFSEKVPRCFPTHFGISDVKAIVPTTHCHSVDALVISICSEIILNT